MSHTLLYDVERFLFIPLAQEQDDGECCGGGVGDGDGVPDAIDAEDGRQDEEEGDDEDDVPAVKTYDVILRVKPEKAAQIHSEMINGQKCLVIPMEEDEHAAINGVNTTI